MQLWLPNHSFSKGDLICWSSLLASEISYNFDNSDKIPLYDCLELLIERIESSNYLTKKWVKEIESRFNENKIISILLQGSKANLFSILKDGNKITNPKQKDFNRLEICLSPEKVWKDKLKE